MGTPPLSSPLADLHVPPARADAARPAAAAAPARRRAQDPQPRRPADVAAEIAADVETGRARGSPRRRAGVPAVTYPETLPVSQSKDDILAAIRDHQVVIVAGETGSGKTTQLPKICLELGRGVTRPDRPHPAPPDRRPHGRRAHRRGAAAPPLGEAVGYKVRFTDQVERRHAGQADDRRHPAGRDRRPTAMLRAVRHAHHRRGARAQPQHRLHPRLPRAAAAPAGPTSRSSSPRRPSTPSASPGTSATRRSSRSPGARIPVEVRYRPLLDEDATTPTATRSPRSATPSTSCAREGPGDILVFLSGEREIRDTADALDKQQLPQHRGPAAVRPAVAAEQHRVFQRAHRPPDRAGHQRRRDLADRPRHQVRRSTRAPPASPATATAPRCSGCRSSRSRRPAPTSARAAAAARRDGICIRLYSEDDFLARPEFTDPEILRTNLASVILQMTALGLGDIAAFPFVDPPDRRNIKDGVQLLQELGALDPTRRTAQAAHRLGRKLAQLPVDPRLARMVLEADRNGCVREVMVIAAALSIQDPRERPADKQQAGRRAARAASPTRSRTSWPSSTCGTTCASSRRSCPPAVPPAVPGRVPQLPAGPRVAGPLQPAAHGRQAAGHPRRGTDDGRPPAGAPRRCSPGCSRTSA